MLETRKQILSVRGRQRPTSYMFPLPSMREPHGRQRAGDEEERRSLLLGDTEGLSGSAGRLGLLTTDLDAQVVTETSVLAGLLHALEILTETGINHVGDELRVGTILDTSLSVEEPHGNAVLLWLGNNIGNLFNISFSKFTSTLVQVNLGNLEGQDGKTSTETLDDSKGEGGLLLSVNVGVLHTQDVHEVIGVLNNEARLKVTD